MDSKELRKTFLEFFEEKGHRLIPSSSLIPDNDSSVLFTTAGMQQFKPYYSGQKDPFRDEHPGLGEPLNTRMVTSCQKCIRTTDIMAVGDASHLTFFEMLGNFSFGGYYKKEAIHYAWEFINQILRIPQDRIKITVFGGDTTNDSKQAIPFDKESFEIWKGLGLEGKITRGNKEDNFWGPTGKEGPCGPTSEIYVDGIEIWNLVFNEYYQQSNGELKVLSSKGVDTGMGLERLCLVMQYPQDKQKTIFDTDLFNNLINYLHQQGRKGTEESAYRIIADHLRSSIFLVGAGIVPSNLGQGYILRRLIRRMIRYERIVQLKEEWLKQAIRLVTSKYSNFYPELNNIRDIYNIIEEEKVKFQKTLTKGIKEWQKISLQLQQGEKRVVPGVLAFRLYESYGFPLELLIEMAQEQGLIVDTDGFEKEFQQHRLISRAGQERKFGGHGLKNNEKYSEEDKNKVTRLHTATHLLLAALRKLVDPNTIQKGSDITPERLRFDFSLSRPLTKEEIKKIENWVNGVIKENVPVTHYVTDYKQAVQEGALGSFKDRYPERVTVYEIKSNNGTIYSKEICAGPHVESTGEIGEFQILKERSAAQGIRRIRAIVK